MKTAVIYARYSNDRHQKDRSIEDQVAEGNVTAQRFAHKVLRSYEDRGISGEGMLGRPGLLAMLKAAKRGEFNAVIVEATSRLSRDEEHTQKIFKRLKFYNVVILTRSGPVSKIQASVDGIVNSQFIENLRTSVKRAANNLVRDGLIPGKVAYGYRGVVETLPNGLTRFKPGVREIDPEKATVVLRIFQEYVGGKSPREIAAGLTRDGIPSPTGGVWNPSKIVSGGTRAGCLFSNELYIGRLVWNKTMWLKDPDTEIREARLGNPDDIIVQEVPHLRIVPQDLWEAVHAHRQELGRAKFGPTGKRRSSNIASSEKYILVGMLRCATCGGNMMIGNSNMDGTPRVVCSSGQRRMGCEHTKSYSLQGLQDHVLQQMKARLTDPAAVLEYTRAYHARWAERQKEIKADRAGTQQALDRVEAQITRVVDVITESATPAKALSEKLDKLEAERVSLAARLADIDKDSNVVELHPAAVDKFCVDITHMHAILNGDVPINDIEPARIAFRNVFDRFVVIPTGKRKPYQIEPHMRLSAITGLDLFPKRRTYQEIVEEEGLANRNCGRSGSRWSPDRSSNAVISLGLWQQAA